MEKFLTLRPADNEASESTLSDLNGKPVIVLDDFGVDRRFDISGKNEIELIIAKKDQSIFEVSYCEIRNNSSKSGIWISIHLYPSNSQIEELKEPFKPTLRNSISEKV